MAQAPATAPQAPTQTGTAPAEESLSQKAEKTIDQFKKALDDQRLNIAMQVLRAKSKSLQGPESDCTSISLDTKNSCQGLLEQVFKDEVGKADSRHKILFDLLAKFESKSTEAFEALKAEYSKPGGGQRDAVSKLSKNLTDIIDVYFSHDKINLKKQDQLLDMTPEARSKEMEEIRKGPLRPLPESVKPVVK